MHSPHPSIGDQLRAKILASGFSRREIGRRTGVSAVCVSKFMNGANISLATAEAIARELRLRTLKVPRRA